MVIPREREGMKIYQPNKQSQSSQGDIFSGRPPPSPFFEKKEKQGRIYREELGKRKKGKKRRK